MEVRLKIQNNLEATLRPCETARRAVIFGDYVVIGYHIKKAPSKESAF